MIFDFIPYNKIYKKIPENYPVTNQYSMTFEGWKDYFIISQEGVESPDDFTLLKKIACQTLNSFIDLYKETHVLSEPIFVIKPAGTLIIRIGTIEMEEFEKRFVTVPPGSVTNNL